LLGALTAATLLLLLGPASSRAARLDPQAELAGPPAVTSVPGGGFLAVWPRWKVVPLGFGPDSCEQVSLLGALLTADGEEVPPLHAVRLPGGELGSEPRLARGAVGDVLLSWRSAVGLEAGRLDAFAVDSATVLTSCTPRSHALVAAGDGFWAAWSEACGALRIRARRLDRNGRPVGAAVDLADPGSSPGAGVALAGRSDGGFFAAWGQDDGAGGRVILAGRFDPAGARTATATLSSLPVGTSLAATGLPGDGVVFAWENGGIGVGDRRLLLQRFGRDLVPDGPARQAAESSAPPEEAPVLAAGPGGFFVLSWQRLVPAEDPSDACPFRVFDADARPLSGDLFLPQGCVQPTAFAFAEDGSLLSFWDRRIFPDNICADTQVGPQAPDPLPPAVPPIGLDRFPGFSFRLRIGGDEVAPRIGAEDPVCVPETLCVSGALPGRSEVLVRIVGPKPNGYLWPTVARFTTSTVELWIEQLATGRARYYRLEGPGPGSDELPGFFDRTGFEP
jgi:hypothetical protein